MLTCSFLSMALLECTNVTPQSNGFFFVIARKVAFKVKMDKERVNTVIRGKLKADGYVFKVIFLQLWLNEEYIISSLDFGLSNSCNRYIFTKMQSCGRKVCLGIVNG